jgi:hypothetical protein
MTAMALFLLLGAVGVASAASVMHGAPEAAPTDPPIDAAQGKPNWRWIGERTNTSIPCPPAAGWTAKPLFCEALTPSDPLYGPCTSEGPAIPPGLLPFCVYEFTAFDTPVTQSDLNVLMALKNSGQLSRLDPDSMGVAGFGSGMQDDIWQQLANHFKQQTGRPNQAPFVPLVPSPLIRVTAVDTQPTSGTDADLLEHHSNHGNALVNMGDELLCNDSGDCAATPASRLALGYICPLDVAVNKSNCRDPVLGGFIGTLGDLARALRLETRAWIDPVVSGRRLVLNLSVAWHPRFGGLQTNLTDMEAPVRAVYAAISDAQCRGALTIAAAGNITGGPESQSGPMLPAAWEQRPALTQSECQSRLGATPPNIFPPAGNDHRPFVYAAAGVDGADLPLGNARPNSEPSFVAYGDHADVQDESIGGELVPTATLTGSSVAAMVVSSAAGWTWFFANDQITPALKPYQIMEILYNTGNKLPRNADFCLGGTTVLPCPANPPPQVTEVQICKAINSIAGPPTCPTVIPLDLAFEDVGFFSVSLSLFTTTLTDPTCPQQVRYVSGAQPANPCPFSQFFSRLAEPWTVEQSPSFTAPQPNDAPCPNCGGGHARVLSRSPALDQNLWIEIDDDRDWSLTDATLQCGNELYAIGPYLVVKGLSPLVPGSKVKLLLDDGRCLPGSDMKLYFRDDSGESTVDTLLQAGSLDTDEDGVPDASDNCTEVVNADQRDTNGDGIGNACDPDLTGDCVVNFSDLGALEAVFFTSDPDADFDGSGSVNFTDLGVLKSFFFLPPGPSGVPNACSL